MPQILTLPGTNDQEYYEAATELGIYMVGGEVGPAKVRACLSRRHGGDILLVLSEGSFDDNLVFHLLQGLRGSMAKQLLARIVAVVEEPRTRVSVEGLAGWKKDDDLVICRQSLTHGLMAHALTAQGAASILANIISPSVEVAMTRSPCKDLCLERNLSVCDTFLRKEYLESLRQVLL